MVKNEIDITLRLSSNMIVTNKNNFLLNLSLTLCGEFSHLRPLKESENQRFHGVISGYKM